MQIQIGKYFAVSDMSGILLKFIHLIKNLDITNVYFIIYK